MSCRSFLPVAGKKEKCGQDHLQLRASQLWHHCRWARHVKVLRLPIIVDVATKTVDGVPPVPPDEHTDRIGATGANNVPTTVAKVDSESGHLACVSALKIFRSRSIVPVQGA